MLTEADVEALFAQHRQRLFNGAYRFTRSTSAAEDAVSVAFLKLWRHRATIREPQFIGTWLYRVMLTWCLQRHRTMRRRPGDYLPLLPGVDRASRAPGPDVALLVEQLLADRPNADLLRRHYLAGETVREIATAIGATEKAVHIRLHRARHYQPKPARHRDA